MKLFCAQSFPSSVPHPARLVPVKAQICRRQLLQSTFLAFAPVVAPSFASSSVTGTVQSYTDTSRKFSLSYPSGWTYIEGTIPDGDAVSDRLIAWHPADVPANDVNITLKITFAAADFTKLGSFGSAEDFGTNLVNSMDRSYLKGGLRRRLNGKEVEVPTARLISATNTSGMYRIEYFVKRPEDEERRLISLFALRFDGVYNKLYTLTSQCYEKQFSQYESEIQSILESFQPPGTA